MLSAGIGLARGSRRREVAAWRRARPVVRGDGGWPRSCTASCRCSSPGSFSASASRWRTRRYSRILVEHVPEDRRGGSERRDLGGPDVRHRAGHAGRRHARRAPRLAALLHRPRHPRFPVARAVADGHAVAPAGPRARGIARRAERCADREAAHVLGCVHRTVRRELLQLHVHQLAAALSGGLSPLLDGPHGRDDGRDLPARGGHVDDHRPRRRLADRARPQHARDPPHDLRLRASPSRVCCSCSA